jgi:hypothetical protein
VNHVETGTKEYADKEKVVSTSTSVSCASKKGIPAISA